MKVNVDWNEWNGLMWNGVFGDPNCRMNDDRISIDVWLIVMWNDINWLESRDWMNVMIRWIDWLWDDCIWWMDCNDEYECNGRIWIE